MNVKPKNKAQAVLFQSPYLEILTKSHPLVIWGIFLPVSAYLMWLGVSEHALSLRYAVIIFITGVLSWTLFEYLMHRYVFHFVSESPRVQKFIYTAHGIH